MQIRSDIFHVNVQVITTAASFNVSLFKMIGSVIGDEARAFINDGGASGCDSASAQQLHAASSLRIVVLLKL